MYGYRVYKCSNCDYTFNAYEGVPSGIEANPSFNEMYLYATYPMHCPMCDENYNIDGYKKEVFCEKCGTELEYIEVDNGIISTFLGALKDIRTRYTCPKCRKGMLIRKKGVHIEDMRL